MTTYYWKMYFNCTLNFHVFFFLLITGGVCTWLSLPSANNIAFRSSGMIYFSCTYFLKSYKLYQSERIGTTKEKVESEQRIIVSLWITTTVGALRVIRGAKRKKHSEILIISLDMITLCLCYIHYPASNYIFIISLLYYSKVSLGKVISSYLYFMG